jgi:hypothetical protein
LTPACANAAKRPASTEVGLASSVISTSRAVSHSSRVRSITAAAVSGSISDGVPPPKNIVSTRRPGASRAACSSSVSSALRQRTCSTPSRTWLLKSQ